MSGVKLRAISNANPKIQHDLRCITSLDNALAVQDQTLKSVVKAEDAAHADGDNGIMSLAVRKDTAAALGGDGDYVPLITDNEGKLHVVDSATTGIAPAILDITKTEDAAHVSGDKGIMSLVVRKDTAASLASTDGDYAPLQVNASGALRTETASAASRNTTTISNNYSGTALTGNLAQNVASSAIDMNEYAHLSFVIISNSGSDGKELKLEVSADNSTWFDSNNSVFIGQRAVSDGAGGTSNIYVGQGSFSNLTNRYARIVSHSSGTIAFTDFSFSQLN